MPPAAAKLHVYVLHSEKLASRKPMVEALLAKLRANKALDITGVDWITEHEPEALNAALVKEAVRLEKTPEGNTVFDGLVKNMHVKAVSNAFKHREALQRAANVAANVATSAEYFLVIEDDVAFGDDVDAALGNVLQRREEHWDILWLGQPSLTAVEPSAAGSVQLLPAQDQFRVLPACDSYVIKARSAQKIAERFTPIRFQTNVHWSYVLDAHRADIIAKRTSPNLLLDGTKLGVYVSALEPNSRLIFNSEYARLAQLVRKPAAQLTPEDKAEVQRLQANIKFAKHPDVQYLFALHALQNKDYAAAKDIMDATYKVYQENQALLSGESEFLAAYIDVHKHVQPALP